MTDRPTFDPFEQRIAAEFERYVQPATDPKPISAIVGAAMRPRGLVVRARNQSRPRSFLLLGIAAAFLLPATYLVAGSLGLPTPDQSNRPSPATSAGSDGLILFGNNVGVGDGTHCTTFYTIRPDGSDERQLAGGCVPYGEASWSPAGDSIIIDSHPLYSAAEISEVAADGGAQRPLLTLGGSYATFSPDGSQIAYTADSGGIVIADADDLNPRHLTSTLDVDLEPRFSPDGSRLAFTRMNDAAGGPLEVWVVNTDGTDLHRLTPEFLSSDGAHWSPDGSHLLFTGRQSVNGSTVEGLWTIAADGTGLTPVINSTGGHNQDADWSPDGSRIVFTRLEDGLSSLRVMNADGSGGTTLLSDIEGGQFQSLDWGLPSTLPTEAP